MWNAVYDKETQTMKLTFPNGRTYEFEGVPPDIYENFQKAESKGTFYNTYLRGQY